MSRFSMHERRMRSITRARRVKRPVYRARMIAVLAVTAIVMTLLMGRLFQLQVLDGASMSAAAQSINSRSVSVPAVRGRILDSAGAALVANGSTSVLTVTPTALADSRDNGRQLLTRVAAAVHADAEQLIARTKVCGTKGAPKPPICFSGNAVEPIPILSNVAPRTALSLLEQPEKYPGIGIAAVPTRRYPAPAGASAAQLLGYLGSTNATDLQRNPALSASDLVGRAGLEQQYDTALRGVDGKITYAVDARGLPVRQVKATDPVAGRDVVTHIDARVQAAATSALAATIAKLTKAKSPVTGGAAVVLDASSGAVLAMASNPTYDLSVWNGGISEADYRKLSASGGGSALTNRVINDLQPAASTFKGISLPAAINAGVDPNGTFDCSSSVLVGSRPFHNFESVSFGPISMTKAIEVSCDTVFYRWAYDAWKAEGGLTAPTNAPDPFAAMAAAFRIDRPTGVDLPGESHGTIPSRQWKLATWKATRATSCARAKTGYPEIKDKKQAAYLKAVAAENCVDGYLWQGGDAVNFAIGQGSVTVTPLQMATTYAAIANGGTLWAPHVVAATAASDGSDKQVVPPTKVGTVALPAAARTILSNGLRDVVSQPQGTAYGAFAGFDLASYPISGKTGTGEVFGKDATSWFISYGPKLPSGRQYVVAVMFDQGGTGAGAAAPTARAIWNTLRTVQ